MNIHNLLFIVFGLIVLTTSGYADDLDKSTANLFEQRNKQKTEIEIKNKSKEKHSQHQKLSYSPKFLGSESDLKNTRLVGMALRGGTDNILLSVLTPAHTGLSSKAQPNIYWYISKPVSKSFQFVEFVLNSDQAIKPILRTHLAPVLEEGIQKLSLSDYNVSLEAGVQYTWVISLVSDPTARSLDLVTSGTIKHVVPSGEVQQLANSTTENKQASVFAKEGFWYDALAKVIGRVENKSDSSLDPLISLLKQVELETIAENVANVKKTPS